MWQVASSRIKVHALVITEAQAQTHLPSTKNLKQKEAAAIIAECQDLPASIPTPSPVGCASILCLWATHQQCQVADCLDYYCRPTVWPRTLPPASFGILFASPKVKHIGLHPRLTVLPLCLLCLAQFFQLCIGLGLYPKYFLGRSEAGGEITHTHTHMHACMHACTHTHTHMHTESPTNPRL